MFSRKRLIATVVLAAFIATGCAIAQGTVSEESLGLRDTDLFTEETTKGELTAYNQAAPGESQLIPRAFENAPPMIPHSVEGLLPITTNNNSCLGCHSPEVAEAMQSTAIPSSHFASFRPVAKHAGGVFKKDGSEVVNTTDIKMIVRKKEDLSHERFSCTQCHAPQSVSAPLVDNLFNPDFRNEGDMLHSNLLDVINEGVR